jgi:hypothetical protein
MGAGDVSRITPGYLCRPSRPPTTPAKQTASSGYSRLPQGSGTVPDRFFPATVMGGRLHVSTGDSPWDLSRFDWWREDELDLILSKGYGEKIRTLEELEAALRAPMKVAPTRSLWIHESLKGRHSRVWRELRRQRRGVPTRYPPW